ncbi:MAG: radical SAM protein [Candidatus Shapirobacteria bacterium]|jgi:radical SAM superfamily enzyme YgiQ (UPF0313 family)
MIKKVLFCIPPFPNRYGLPTHPHTGIGYLSQSLEVNGIESRVVDFRLGNGYEILRRTIEEFKPDLFGVTVMTYYHNLAYEIVGFLKQFDKPIAVGGPHVSTLKEVAVKESGADYGFMNEAEISLVEFCKGKPLKQIDGLIYRQNKKLKINQPMIIEELDLIPFPKYKNVDMSQYTRKRVPIISSRGCPYQCIFCPISTVMGKRYRFRSAENIFSELKYWYDIGYRDFDFQDDNFTVNKERVYRLFDLIEKAKMKDLFMQCGNGIRADLSTEELLKRMKDVGFKAIAFGVETFDSEVLVRVKKGETNKQIEKAVKMALKVGLEVSLFFIVGLPGETTKTFKKSIDFALKYPISTATFYNLIPFPGTELFKWVTDNGLFILQPNNYLNTIAHLEFVPIFETKDFTAEERKKALVLGSWVNMELKRRDMTRKLGGLAIAFLLSWLIYKTFLTKVIFRMIKIGPIKRLINFVLLKLKLRLNL